MKNQMSRPHRDRLIRKSAKEGWIRRIIGFEDTMQFSCLIVSVDGRPSGLANRLSMATLVKGFRRKSVMPMIALKSAMKSSSSHTPANSRAVRYNASRATSAVEVVSPRRTISRRLRGSCASIKLHAIEAHTKRPEHGGPGRKYCSFLANLCPDISSSFG